MPDPHLPAPAAWRRWIPSVPTAILLFVLAGLTALLRKAIVLPKDLTKAQDRWAALRANPEGASLKWEDAAVLGTHWSTLAALGLLAAAILTMRFWQPAAGNINPASSPAARAPRWFTGALVGLVLLGGALRLPLATGSLWWDELWNLKFATVGEWRQDPANPDNTRFQTTSWSRAAWYYNKPTNHPVFTLPSKAAHETWRALTQPSDPGAFNELVIRLPVLLGGLAAVFLTGMLGRRLAGERAGLLAAALMALHPWLIRYGVDARSYGLAVAFVGASMYALERATSPDTRRPGLWWLIFGACQFFLMWSHVVAQLAVCAGLFAAAAGLIFRRDSAEKWRELSRLIVINALAAALLLVAFLPNLLQAMNWGGRNDDGNFLTGSYFLRTLSQIVSGMDPPPGPGTEGLPFLPWWALGLLTLGGLAAVTAGILTLFRQRGAAVWIPLSVAGGVAVFLLMVRLTDFYFYHRFILAASVPLLLLAGIGLSRLKPSWLALIAIGGFAALTFPQTRVLMTRSYAPFRETVSDLRAEAARQPGKVIPVCYGLGSHVMQCYYPELRFITSNGRSSLQALIDQARRENRPLLLAIGYHGINRLNLPDGFQLIDDPALFEKLGTRHGIEPEFTFDVLRLKPATP